MKKIFVYSTLATDMAYTNHEAGGGDLPLPLDPVFIAGGAGVNNDRLFTPHGVATEVSPEQLLYLESNQVFQLHKRNGFIKVAEGEAKDVEAVTGDMSAADPSRQLVEADFTNGEDGEPTPTTSKDGGKGGGKGKGK